MTGGGGGRSARRWEAAGLVFAMVFPTVAAWLYFFTFARSPAMPAVYLACKVAQFSLPLAWVWLGVLRLPGRGTGMGASGAGLRRVQSGLGWGAAMATVLLGAYILVVKGTPLAATAAPRIAARIEAIGATTLPAFLAMALLISVMHSFLEEYYWRWLVFGRLRAFMGGRPAGLVSSLAFAGHHIIVLHAFIGPGPYVGMSVLLSLAVVAGGMLWAWLYARTGSLTAPWLSHVLVDLAIFAIGHDMAWRLVSPVLVAWSGGSASVGG